MVDKMSSLQPNTCQLSQNVWDSPRFCALVPCPARKMLFTLNVPENLVTNYPDLLRYWYHSWLSPYKTLCWVNTHTPLTLRSDSNVPVSQSLGQE